MEAIALWGLGLWAGWQAKKAGWHLAPVNGLAHVNVCVPLDERGRKPIKWHIVCPCGWLGSTWRDLENWKCQFCGLSGVKLQAMTKQRGTYRAPLS